MVSCVSSVLGRGVGKEQNEHTISLSIVEASDAVSGRRWEIPGLLLWRWVTALWLRSLNGEKLWNKQHDQLRGKFALGLRGKIWEKKIFFFISKMCLVFSSQQSDWNMIGFLDKSQIT